MSTEQKNDTTTTTTKLSKQQELVEKANQFLSQRKVLDALKTYDQAIRIDPKHPHAYAAHSNMSACCFMIGKYVEALRSADSCLVIDDKLPSGHLRRANALEKLGRVEEALDEYKKEIEISPELQDAKNGKLRCTTILNQKALAAMTDEEKSQKRTEAIEGLKKSLQNIKDEKTRKQKAIQFVLHGCAQKDLEEVKAAVEFGNADINPPPPPFPAQFTPLLIAVDRQATEIVRYLLEKGADVNRAVDANRTPLLTASLIGDVETCKALVEFDADLEAATEDEKKSRALHLAAHNGHDEVVQFLVDVGAEVSSRDGMNATPLAWTVLRKNTECVRILLEGGANPLADGTEAKESCLMIAASVDEEGEIMKLLLEKYVGEEEEIYRALKTAAENQKLAAFEALLDFYSDLSRSGNVPLAKAIRILSYTVDKENKERVALTTSLLHRVKDTTRAITTPAAQIATSALQVVVMQNSLDLLKLFVEDPKIAFDINSRERDQIQLGQRYTALHLAIRHKKMDIIKYLVKDQKDKIKVNIAGFDGLMPIHLAAANGHIPTLRLLVEAGAKIDAVVNDDAKKQAIEDEENADEAEETSVVSDEKDKKRDAATKSEQEKEQQEEEKLSFAVAEGATPLIFAAVGGQNNMCVELIQQGARIDCQVSGQTPLEIVCGFPTLMTVPDENSASSSQNAAALNNPNKDVGHHEVVKALLAASESGKCGQYSQEVLKHAYEAAVENKHRSLADLIKKKMEVKNK